MRRVTKPLSRGRPCQVVMREDIPHAPCCCRPAVVEICYRPYCRKHAIQVLKGLARELGYEVKKMETP